MSFNFVSQLHTDNGLSLYTWTQRHVLDWYMCICMYVYICTLYINTCIPGPLIDLSSDHVIIAPPLFYTWHRCIKFCWHLGTVAQERPDPLPLVSYYWPSSLRSHYCFSVQSRSLGTFLSALWHISVRFTRS